MSDVNSLTKLVAHLKRIPVKRDDDGILMNRDEVNAQAKLLLQQYDAEEDQEWRKFAYFDPKNNSYYRNIIDQTKDWTLLTLTWPTGIQSPIHSHSRSSCFVKMLEGQLVERLYYWPKEGQVGSEMVEIAKNTYTMNGVSYMEDEIGLHSMQNPDHSVGAISLHFYCPGYVFCECFDMDTSRSHQGEMHFHTIRGTKTEWFGQ